MEADKVDKAKSLIEKDGYKTTVEQEWIED